MSTETDDRQQRLFELSQALRKMSAQGTLFGQVVADRLGIGSSDLECLDVLQLQGSATPGELARATGLTTGAITGVVDRLERAGFVKRTRDTVDRRKVRITVTEDAVERILPLYLPLQQRTMQEWSRYDDDQIEFLLSFARASHAALVEETTRLRKDDPDTGVPRAAGSRRTRD